MAGSPTNYTEFQASVLAWLDDATLSARVPEMIGLAENRLSRKINRPEMEVTGVITVTNGVGNLPADNMGLRGVYIDSAPRRAITAVSEEEFNDWYGVDSGEPTRYTIVGNSIRIGPTTATAYAVQVSYKQAIPSLSALIPTNWLLTTAPDLYLFHSVLMAEAYGWNDTRLPLLKSWVDELLDEVNIAGAKKRYGDGPLVMRSPVVNNWRSRT